MANDRIRIYIDASVDATLKVDEVWPDGDAPDDPTAQDVVELMKKHTSIQNMLDEWSLNPEIVFVRVTDGKNETMSQWLG